ncbi:hypothetical protein ACZ91_49680 [Streptomyces regensis]|nr:hypothetical protein [Streptomyces antibioticus]KMS84133.1 hypothetical protein ACZ91_49680 [Streptomyces regensis]KOG73016.1 hypothetical protein ADK77_09625 [Streptomyces antibioticus]
MVTGAGTGRLGSNDAQHPIGTRLNQLPDDLTGTPGPAGPIGGQKDLASSPAQKQAAANAIEKHIEPDTRKAGNWADAETDEAVREFRDGWHTSGALKKAHEAWEEQVKNLMNMLASDKAALRSANTVLQNTDIQTGASVRSASVIYGY